MPLHLNNVISLDVNKLNRLSIHVDLAGEVNIVGVLWTTVGQLAVAAGELYIQDATPATVPLVLPPKPKLQSSDFVSTDTNSKQN